MGCAGCSIAGDGTPKGCGSKGHCSTGGCNKMNTYDWLSNLDLHDPTEYQMVEVSFKKGARKEFFRSNPHAPTITGDLVVVEAKNGYDVGRISLSGELVRLQMRKKKVTEDRVLGNIIRIAHERDIERLEEARSKEKETMVRARVIARTMDLNMKIGDIEYQGDNRKATFYYTADGRIDFRELVRSYAKEFKVKIEMRQIGSRQESARIGGLGPCGRELCCSTWLSDFKSVSTSAARYQNLAINQTKLSGQCGRLKCCLNYELDNYIDALSEFPKRADVLRTAYHKYELIKTDIFKGLMFYIQVLERGRGPIVVLDKDRVKEVLELNKNKEYPEEIGAKDLGNVGSDKEEEFEYEDVTGQIELPALPSRRKGKSRNNRSKGGRGDRRKPRNPSGERSRPSNDKERKPEEKRDNKKAPQGDKPKGSRPSNRKRPNRSKRKPPENRPPKEGPKN
ncbi:MAG: cell fate regulator YaaT (PSP1 superfamily) [Saprospiraceae bacterium]|jgi:cell fate regulator YaaT (PSP1 superfamily)